MSEVAERLMKERNMRIDVTVNRDKYKIPADFDIDKFNFEDLEYIIENEDASEVLTNYL